MYKIQVANWWKRFSAFLLDFILIIVIATGFAFLFSAILNYDQKVEDLKVIQDKYAEEYDVKFNLTSDDYAALTDEEKAHYEEVDAILVKDEEYLSAYRTLLLFSVILITVGAFFGVLITEFVFPLIFKNGQTLGKKIFNLAVICPTGVVANGFQLFIRAMVGKFAVEIMIPIFLLMFTFVFPILGAEGIVGLAILGIIQIVIFLTRRNHELLHDLMAVTVVCDKETQMIFASKEEMIKYKQQKALEEATKEPNKIY